MLYKATTCLSTSSTTDNLETTATSSYSSSSIRNFHKSETPSRILFIKNNTWVDFPDQSFQKLQNGFISGNRVQQIEIQGRSYAIDFHRMVQIDLLTRVENPIAWIDASGHCFFSITNQTSDLDITPRFPEAELLREDDKSYKIVEKLTSKMVKAVSGELDFVSRKEKFRDFRFRA